MSWLNAPRASSEDIRIEDSTQNLTRQSSRAPISSTLVVYDSDRSSKRNQYPSSREKIEIKDASTEKSLGRSKSQSHRSNDESISKTLPRFNLPLSLLKDRRTRDEECKANIRNVPRLSSRQIEITHSPSEDDHLHTASQKRIRVESVPECLDLTVVPSHFSTEIIASPLRREQSNVKGTHQSSKSSSRKISPEKINIFEDFLLTKTDYQRGQCGLRNIGNTCFMNSALQCLSNVPDLTEYILKKGFDSNLNTTNVFGTQGKLALAYAGLIKVMWSGTQKDAEGSAVKQYVSESSPRFLGYNQHDSHEFLNVLLGILHEDLKEDSKDTENEISLISKIFYGQLRSAVTCACGEPLITFESISFLALPIPVLPQIPPRRKQPSKSLERAVTLTDCFNELFKVEMIGENGQWYCNKCECLKDAKKKLDIWTPPKVLILQLKRFTYDIWNNAKIQTLVEFPFDSPLDLHQFITDPNYKETTLYDLAAISSHTGSLAGGHYTTYAKNFLTKKWLHFNDQIVCDANEKDLQSPNAYILVYRRQEIDLLR